MILPQQFQVMAQPTLILESGLLPLDVVPADLYTRGPKPRFGQKSSGQIRIGGRIEVDPDALQEICAAARILISPPGLLVVAVLRPWHVQLSRIDVGPYRKHFALFIAPSL